MAQIFSRQKIRTMHNWMQYSKHKKGTTKPQKFQHLLALDFEATCLKDRPIDPQEIIEIPCLKISSRTFQVESIFHSYVRPVYHPKLSNFCVELTGINQGMVDEQPDFSEVFSKFQSWMTEEKLFESSFAFVTCGDWDFKTCLTKQCEISNIPLPIWASQWINIKKSQRKVTGNFPRSMHGMLNDLGLQFQGRHHSGIDDTKNIAIVIKELALRGHIFEYTSSFNSNEF